MNAALTQQHLYVGLMRLRIEVVYQKYGQIYFLAYNHCGNLRISSHRA
jgi:hypothetical protein